MGSNEFKLSKSFSLKQLSTTFINKKALEYKANFNFEKNL